MFLFCFKDILVAVLCAYNFIIHCGRSSSAVPCLLLKKKKKKKSFFFFLGDSVIKFFHSVYVFLYHTLLELDRNFFSMRHILSEI